MLLVSTTVFICIFPILVNGIDLDSFNYQLSGRAMAANQRLVVSIRNRSKPSFDAVQDYTSTSPKFCSLTLGPSLSNDLFAMMVAVAENTGISSNANRFIFAAYAPIRTSIYLVVVNITFPACSWTANSPIFIYNTTYPQYSSLAVNSDWDWAFYFWNSTFYMLKLSPIIGPGYLFGTNIRYPSYFYAISINQKRDWGILAGYQGMVSTSASVRRLKPTLYAFDFAACYTHFNSSCYQLWAPWSLNYVIFWHVNQAPALDFYEDPYNPLYDISVSIKDTSNILVGIQSINTVYRFSYVPRSFLYIRDSRSPTSAIAAGFGKSVAWLDNNTIAVLANSWTYHYSVWYSSQIDLYSLNYFGALSNRISPYVSFPNGHRKLWSKLNSQMVEMTSVIGSDAVIFMDVNGIVHIITSSAVGKYSDTMNGNGLTNGSIFVAPVLNCIGGTFKNQTSIGKDLFLACDLCPVGTFYQPSASTSAVRCTPCNLSTSFCPYGAVNQLTTSILQSIDQLQAYPETPENDVLEDILLINMFNMNFSSQCLTKQPMFWAIIIVGIGCIVLLFMGLLKLIKKCGRERRVLKLIFKQTDLIGEGELWIGGVASFSILVICVFAYRFSSGFINQYPIETAGESTFACDNSLINAKFSTTMKSLATPIPEEDVPLFNLLDQQPFKLSVDFLNTAFDIGDLNVMQVAGTYRWNISTIMTSNGGILCTLTNLSSHNIVIEFNLTMDASIGAFRVGLSAPSNQENNYYVQQLNFTQVFNYTNRILTQDPEVTIQLIRVINETQPLSNNGEIDYSAIWIPTFIYNEDQLFYTYEKYVKYHTKGYTILRLTINEASYYISNVQEPITRITELIFTNILFSTMCIELFALTFLFCKLAIYPLIKLMLGENICKRKVRPNQNLGCPYCQPFDINALPAYQVRIERANLDANQLIIQRRSQIKFDLNNPITDLN